MSFRDYVANGWALCEFSRGEKGPTGPAAVGWNTRARAITDPQRVNGMVQGGLLHALSGTAALDIDHMEEARKYLLGHGVNLDDLLGARDAVQISSGRANRAKLLYRLPAPLVSKKLGRYVVEDIVTGKPKTYHALELRCATRQNLSVQDVLPPSIHPTTGLPYEWRYGDPLAGSWRNLPLIPPALQALWETVAAHPEEPTHEPVQPVTDRPPLTELQVAELRSYLGFHDPDGPYDEWVGVGMALHDATGGAPEGLALWDEWSRQGTKYGAAAAGQLPQYPHDKWHSFTAGHGYTIGYLKSKAPAALESFPLVAGEFDGSKGPAPEDTRPGAVIRRALAPLVFISSQGTYYDTSRRALLNLQSIEHLYTPLMPVVHTVGANGAAKSYQPKPTEELRRASWKEEVYGMGMHPGQGKYFSEGGQRYLNTYEDPGIELLQPTQHEQDIFQFMWTRPDEKVFRQWLLQFFAHAVQQPGVKITAAPLLVGHATGSGKNTLMKVLPELLFSPRYVTTMTNQILQGQFSDQLANAWWVYFEELHAGTNKGDRVAVSNRVKSWITDNTVVIRPMFGKAYDAPNRLQITASSNYEDDAIHVDESDRRWVMGHIDKSMSDSEAGELYKFLESPRAPGVLRHIFSNVSLAGFNPRARAPETRAKRTMINVNYGLWESKILELIENRAPPFDKDIVTLADVLMYLKAGGMTPNRLGRVLQRAPFNMYPLPVAYGARRYIWRNIELWTQMGAKAQSDYHTDGVRPSGHKWTDQLPAELAEACGVVGGTGGESAPCDLL